MTLCAYCHHPLGDADVEHCPTCNTPHHAECWEENGGCAVALCDGGPKVPFIPPSPEDLAAPRGRMNVSFDEEGTGSGARARRRRRALKAVLATVVLLLVIGALLAFLVASKSSAMVGPRAAAPTLAR